MTRLTRRAVLGGSTAGLLAAASGRPARAAVGGTLVVANWGGDWNERTVRFVEAPFTKKTGVTIVHELSMEPERKTKLVAEKHLRRGTVDVAHFNDSDAYQMNKQEVLTQLDPARIPNLADVVPALKRPYFLPWLYSGVVLIYNTAKVPVGPKSYADLWDAKWNGRLGFTTQVYFNMMMMAGLIHGGSVTNTEAGKTRLMDLKALVKPKIYATHGLLEAALSNGEVDLAVDYKSRGLQWKKDGLPVQVAYPTEGAIATTFGATLPMRAQNVDTAYAYLDAMLDPAAMAGMAGETLYAPANMKTPLSPELKALVSFSPAEQEQLKFPDYDYVATHTSEWLEWWNKDFTS